jgi:predicted nucleic acid-binding Zn ribbon protein
VSRRRAPREASLALDALTRRLAPATLLAEVQRVWPEAVGPAVAAEATPTAERGGTLVVTCSSSVWAQELTLMAPDLTARLNDAIGRPAVRGLRCQAATSRRWARDGGDTP